MRAKQWTWDGVLWALAGIGLATRLWMLDKPSAVVFDELYYVRFVSLYLNRTFHFDPDPPLGKLLVSLSACLSGANVTAEFSRIGDVYPPSLSIWWMRFVPAVMGGSLVPVSFGIMTSLGFGIWTSSLAAVLVILENALLTQSRFVLMETPLIFFISMAILSYIEFRRVNNLCPFTRLWFFWLGFLGLCLACAVCIKYIAICTVGLITAHSVIDFWKILPDKSLSDRTIFKHLVSRVVFLGVLPVLVYISIFYIHLGLLVNAGPHDDIMTSAFQASLRGGLSSITQGQPQFVAYGSQVTLRRTHGKPCWLHSHNHLYPVEYADGRGSSHQQQVTCYAFKDVNNWWIVKDPNRTLLIVDDPVRHVLDGDVIQLVHGMTSRALNSHDVAAPMSPQFPEVSCYISYDDSLPPQTLWMVKIVNAEKDRQPWRVIESTVHLTHVGSSQALKTSGRQLDDWGFYQMEVVTDRLHQQPSTVWNVEEHRYTYVEDEEVEEFDDLSKGNHLTKEIGMGFFRKFWELQVKMLTSLLGASIEHRYSSEPQEWPLMARNIIYWCDTETHAQIHLLGNAAIWFPATGAVLLYAFLLTICVLRRRRRCYDFPEETWNQFVDTGALLFAGYLIHYVPYLFLDRTLFLYQYLVALFFKILLLTALLNHLYAILQNWSVLVSSAFLSLVGLWLCLVLAVFLKYSALTFGLVPMTSDLAENLRLFEAWDFIVKRN